MTDVFSTISTEEKYKKLRVLIEEHDAGNNEVHEETLKVLFAGIESEHDTLKSKFIKTM